VAVTIKTGWCMLPAGDGAGRTPDGSVKKAAPQQASGRPASSRRSVEHPDATGLRDMNNRILIIGGLPIKVAEVIGDGWGNAGGYR
jgi:hypothetical protein